MDLKLHSLQLREFSLVSINASRVGSRPGENSIQLNLELQTQHEDLPNAPASIAAVVKVSITPATTLASGKSFSVAIVARAVFDSENQTATIDRAALRAFATTQGPVLMWPYLRSEVFDISGKLGLTPIHLPLLDVIPTVRNIYRELSHDETSTD